MCGYRKITSFNHQIAATIIILAIGGNSEITCGKPLQLYLIIFVVRVGLSLPLSIYQHLFTPRSRRRNARRRAGARRNGYRRNATTANATTATATTTENAELPAVAADTTTTISNNDDNQHQETVNNQEEHQNQEEQQNQEQSASLISGWTDR